MKMQGHQSEVIPVREPFRPYLKSPLENKPHTSLSGDTLSAMLEILLQNPLAFNKNTVQFMLQDRDVKLPVVYITEEEELESSKIQNKSKEEFRKETLLLIEHT